jgi:alkaline phosphatase
VAGTSELSGAILTQLGVNRWGAALLLFAIGCGDFDETSSGTSRGLRHVAVPARLPGIDDQAEPRHLIIVIGDGMQLAHEIATSRYLFGRDDGLSFHQLPTRLFKTTWDVNVYNARASQKGVAPYTPNTFDPMVGYDVNLGGEAPYPLLPDTAERRAYFLDPLIYPDSASTATAMSTGIKTDSSNIAWFTGDPVNGALATTPQTLRRRYGMSIGFVTTVPLSHATPSGWFAHNPERFAYGALGHEILTQTRPDVVIGGGVQAGTSYLDTVDVDAVSSDAAYVVVKRATGVDGAESLMAAAEQARASGQRLFGAFGGPEGNFESPVPMDAPGDPFVARGSTENPRFADAAVAALEVLSANPHGFFMLAEQGDIDWSNHANDFPRMIGCVSDLHEGVQAILDFIDRPGDAVDWSNTTIVITADHANSYLRLVGELGPGELAVRDPVTGEYPAGKITYGTGTHTSELVSVYAKGPGATFLEEAATVYPGHPTIIDDTALYSMTIEAARR